MKKQLRFLYRYIFASRRWRRWINTHTVMATFVSLVFVTALAWGAPISGEKPHGSAARENLAAAAGSNDTSIELQQTSTPVPRTALPTPTRTPFPESFYTNADQTVGVTLAGAALVLIVVVGVLSFLPKKSAEEK